MTALVHGSYNSQKEKVLFLIGPTATGKSEVAVELASKINAEIISCDSMQIYRGMEILSSIPSRELRKRIKHHLIATVNPDTEYNVYQYYKKALKIIKQILKKGKVPLFVGGSGLYINTLLEGIFKLESDSLSIRDALYKEAKEKGVDYLYEELKKVDFQASLKIHPHDLKRIVRALEVYKITGLPISELQKKREGLINFYDVTIFALDMPKERIYQRIKQRIEQMIKMGLIKEVEKLIKIDLSKTASSAIGIEEIKGYLKGCYKLEEAKKIMEKRTKLLVKKQLCWFRRIKQIKWIKVEKEDTPQSIAEKIEVLLNK